MRAYYFRLTNYKIHLTRAAFYILFFIYFEFLQLYPGVPCSSLTYYADQSESQLRSLLLNGVIVSRNSRASVAVLKNEPPGEIFILKTGDKIDELELVQISENGVVFHSGENIYTILLGKKILILIGRHESKVAGKNSTNNQEVAMPNSSKALGYSIKKEFSRSEIETRLQNELPTLMQQTRLSPNIAGDKIEGFKITQMSEASILSMIGIQTNDIIKGINGVALNDATDGLQLFNKLKTEKQFEVILERGGKPFRILYILK